jgi:hypothetical protein
MIEGEVRIGAPAESPAPAEQGHVLTPEHQAEGEAGDTAEEPLLRSGVSARVAGRKGAEALARRREQERTSPHTTTEARVIAALKTKAEKGDVLAAREYRAWLDRDTEDTGEYVPPIEEQREVWAYLLAQARGEGGVLPAPREERPRPLHV